MDKLKNIIVKYGRWSALSVYLERIETHIDSDFSLCIENAKALLESISKQICKERTIPLDGAESINKLVKLAFEAIGFEKEHYVNTIGGSLSAIAHQLGNLRTAIGATSHGKTLDELENRNNNINALTRDFLVSSVEIIACFLVSNYENEHPRTLAQNGQPNLDYLEAEEFNEFWDESFGEFQMGAYSYAASEILFNVDKQAYFNEYNAFTQGETSQE